MFIKQIVPNQIGNHSANVILFDKEYSVYPYVTEKKGLINFTSAKIITEFYDINKKPLYKYNFVINELPVDNNIRIIRDSDFTKPDAKIMFDAQDKIIVDAIKEKFGLTYYDDTYEIDEKLVFSYILFPDTDDRYYYNKSSAN